MTYIADLSFKNSGLSLNKPGFFNYPTLVLSYVRACADKLVAVHGNQYITRRGIMASAMKNNTHSLMIAIFSVNRPPVRCLNVGFFFKI